MNDWPLPLRKNPGFRRVGWDEPIPDPSYWWNKFDSFEKHEANRTARSGQIPRTLYEKGCCVLDRWDLWTELPVKLTLNPHFSTPLPLP